MSSMEIVFAPELAADDRQAVRDSLIAYNDGAIGEGGPHGEIGLLIKDDTGKTLGGLTATYYYNWMFVELVYVPDHLRGQGIGKRLMAGAERFAGDKGLGGIWLDTFSFQARPFYERLGYEVFGIMNDYPIGSQRFFMQKRLAPATN